MKIKKITLGKSIKLSRNYQSVEANFGVEVEIDEKDDINSIIGMLSDSIEKQLKIEINKQLKVLEQYSN